MIETLTYVRESLKDLYPQQEIHSFVRLIMDHVCGIASYQILSDKDRKISKNEREEIEEIVSRLYRMEPIQYILENSHFYGFDFKVDRSTLIPRPETEELVEKIITDYTGKKDLRVFDICTGSACIAIVLAKHLSVADVLGVDISDEALAIARSNAKNLDAKCIRFQQMNVLKDDILLEEKFDLIVSNPPYVMEREREAMHKNVLDYEPGLALFVPDDNPLLFYRRIASVSKRLLKPNGCLYFEINQQCGIEIITLMKENGYKQIELIKDISGKDRILKAIYSI